jgi:hypothetical protein
MQLYTTPNGYNEYSGNMYTHLNTTILVMVLNYTECYTLIICLNICEPSKISPLNTLGWCNIPEPSASGMFLKLPHCSTDENVLEVSLIGLVGGVHDR